MADRPDLAGFRGLVRRLVRQPDRAAIGTTHSAGFAPLSRPLVRQPDQTAVDTAD